jgi:hypothetical protein
MNSFKAIAVADQSYVVGDIGDLDRSLMKQFLSLEANSDSLTGTYQAVKGLPSDSTFVVLLEGNSQVIGGCRIIHAEDASKLPMAKFSGLSMLGSAVEVVSFFFGPPESGLGAEEKEQLLKLLVYGAAMALRNEQIDRAYARIRIGLYTRFKSWDVPMAKIGPPSPGQADTLPTVLMFAVGDEVQAIVPEVVQATPFQKAA